MTILAVLLPFVLICIAAAFFCRWVVARDARRGVQRDWLRPGVRGGVAALVVLGGGVVVVTVGAHFTSNAKKVDNAGGVYIVAIIAVLLVWRVYRWMHNK